MDSSDKCHVRRRPHGHCVLVADLIWLIYCVADFIFKTKISKNKKAEKKTMPCRLQSQTGSRKLSITTGS